MKKRTIIFSVLLPFILKLPVFCGEPPKTAKILVESSTGQILLSENADSRLPIASVTKIMLLLIAAREIEKGNLHFDDIVTASHYASGTSGSVIWLEPGEQMTAGELFKAIVISSANDASVAVAEHIAGSEEDFVKLMNNTAKEMGLKNTRFTGCVGFDDKNHYSSAYDTALLTAELFRYDYYNDFFKTRLSSVRTGTPRETQLLNTNKLANYYDGILGGKTGTTDGAGYCLSVCAERDGMRLVAVMLGAENDGQRIDVCESLLDSGFKDYERYTAVIGRENLPIIKVPDGVIKEIPLALEKPVNCVIPKGAHSRIEYKFSIPEEMPAPVKAGQKIGEIEGRIGDRLIFKNDVITASGSEKLTFFKSLALNIKALFSL